MGRPGLTAPPVFGAPPAGAPWTPRPAAYAVIVRPDGAVATMLFRGFHYLIGGGALAGEAPEATLRREAREEIGRGLVVGREIGRAYEHFRTYDGSRYYRLEAVFLAADLTAEAATPAEAELLWLPHAAVPTSFFYASHVWAILAAAREG